MRLIDADALETHEQLEPFGNGKYEYVEVVYKDDIDDAPTIEPERAGKWIMVGKWIIRKNTKNAMCPSCHKSFKDVYDMDNYDHYCRHCGLAMDGIINE